MNFSLKEWASEKLPTSGFAKKYFDAKLIFLAGELGKENNTKDDVERMIGLLEQNLELRKKDKSTKLLIKPVIHATVIYYFYWGTNLMFLISILFIDKSILQIFTNLVLFLLSQYILLCFVQVGIPVLEPVSFLISPEEYWETEALIAYRIIRREERLLALLKK